MAGVTIRDAKAADLDGLSNLEAQTFATERMSSRSFRRLIGRPTACLRVAAGGGSLHGYHVVFFRADSPVARLYSIAVAGSRRGAGLGRRLLADAERVVRRRRKRALRLEVREDNRAAIALYEAQGYRLIGRYAAYYADNIDALRYEKALAPGSARKRRTKGTA